MIGNKGPPIRSFTADNLLIPTGTPITLSWDVGDDATSLSIDQGIGDVLPITTDGVGQFTIDPGPAAETTYTLSAANAIATTISQELDLERMLNAILQKVLEVIGAEVGAIRLVERDRDTRRGCAEGKDQ